MRNMALERSRLELWPSAAEPDRPARTRQFFRQPAVRHCHDSRVLARHLNRSEVFVNRDATMVLRRMKFTQLPGATHDPLHPYNYIGRDAFWHRP